MTGTVLVTPFNIFILYVRKRPLEERERERETPYGMYSAAAERLPGALAVTSTLVKALAMVALFPALPN